MTQVVTDVCVRCKYTDCVGLCLAQCFFVGSRALEIDSDEPIGCTVGHRNASSAVR